MSTDRTERILLGFMLVGGIAYHAIRHPRTTYRIIAHRKYWTS